MKKGLTFDDVALVPQYDNIGSRTCGTIDFKTWLTKNRAIDIPILAANMDTVIGEELAEVLLEHGTLPIFHRFTEEKEQIAWAKKFGPQTFMSIGLNVDPRLLDKYAKANVAGVVIDIAHGHSENMLNLIRDIKETHDFDVIAGNVCTVDGYVDLATAGADAVKVGVGPGAACTTRITTGFGVPQFTAIQDCANKAKKYSVPIIADGGIRGSADIAKALAAGATTVMMGKLFALTSKSAAEKRSVIVQGTKDRKLRVDGNAKFTEVDGPNTKQIEAKYRGQASKDFQNEFKGGLKKGTVAEGTDFWSPVTGTTEALIEELLGGLRSAMTYGGARTIGEFQRKAEFIEVNSGSYMLESNPRKS